METVLPHPLLEVTQEDMRRVRQFFELDDVNRIKESLELVEEWCKKQPHLAEAFQYLTRDMLERFFILSRCSVEGTKNKIEKILTIRRLTPELCLNKTIEEFDSLQESIRYLPLPKLCPPDYSRVMITQILPGKLDDFNLLSYIRYCYLLGEYRIKYDYCLSERYILDLKNANMSLITKINPIMLKKAEILCTEGYGTKIKGIHILNAPPFIDTIVALIKQGLKEKVARRVHVHNSYEDLYKEIPKEILPKEYGGDVSSCVKLAEQWKETLRTEDTKKVMDILNKLVAEESKRSVTKFNEEYLGMPGSFRQLTVD